MNPKRLILRNSDSHVLYALAPGTDYDLHKTPAVIGNIIVGDISITDVNCTVVDVADAPADLAPEWYTYANGVFTITSIGTAGQAAVLQMTVPQVVSPAQARIALYNAGIIGAVDTIADNAGVNSPTWSWWHYASEMRRDSKILNALGAQLGLSSSQIDDLFRAASLITP